jgi:3-oxoacyl-[acyl-carrier protein] reductase
MENVSPRIALVTGAATGIGRQAAIRLARRGLAVGINYSRSEDEAKETLRLVQETGARAILCRANVADDQAIRKMVDRCVVELGGLDVLVNNAAITHFVDFKDLEALTEAKWDEIFAVNLKGAFFCARAAIGAMQKAGAEGSIVNLASVAGLTGLGSSIAYAASKAAVISMTKSLAATFGPRVRVNAVCPGPVLTRWLAGHEDRIHKNAANYPLRKPSTPEDIARVVEFLALDADMMTGQAVVVDGGLMIKG